MVTGHMDLAKEQLAALIKVSHSVNASIDKRTVLESLMAVTREVMRVEACSLALLTEDESFLRFEAAVGGKPEEIRRVVLEMGEGLVGWVAEHRQPAIVNDVSQDTRFSPRADIITGFHTVALLCVPVMTRERLVGAMEVLNKTDGTKFTNRDVSFLSAIASQAAIAIDNAQLHEREVQLARLAALGEAVASVAHGVRNVLTSIIYGSKIIEQGLDEAQIAKVKRAWPTVHRATQVLEKLVLDMLAYCKKREPEFAVIDIDQLCTEVCDMERARAAAQGVEIIALCTLADPNLPLDSAAVRHALLNLIDNAIDACEDTGGTVTVATRPDESPGAVQVIVRDTGGGVAPEQIESIFQPFFSTKGTKGTGLGLAVVRKTIEEHSGMVRVESEEGKGSTFTVVLPTRG